MADTPHPHRTALHSLIHQAAPPSSARLDTNRPDTRAPYADEGLLRAAFREVHGRRLHGFALLVTLGDRALATRLAREALAQGVTDATSHRHPERAASWLRHQVVRGVPRRLRRAVSQEERRAALGALGVGRAAYDALARLSVAERTTLVAAGLEGLSGIDLELILGSRRAATPRRILEVRRKFLVGHIESASRGDVRDLPHGPLAEHINRVAGQALATRSA